MRQRGRSRRHIGRFCENELPARIANASTAGLPRRTLDHCHRLGRASILAKRRNEPICKKPDRSMRQVSRRTSASRSQHGLPPSAAVLAKQTQCVDPADAHLSGGKRFRRHEAAGVNRGLIAARRRGRVARRGDRSFLQNTKHKTQNVSEFRQNGGGTSPTPSGDLKRRRPPLGTGHMFHPTTIVL